MSYSDNIGEFMAEMDAMMPTRNHELEISNVIEYAERLHKLTGYWIFNDPQLKKRVEKWLGDVIRAGLPLNDQNIVRALDAAAYEYIDFLKSYTGQMRRPVKIGEGDRQAHPGGWSDITGNLKAAFAHKIDGGAMVFADLEQFLGG